MADDRSVMFDGRFLDRHAGSFIADLAVAPFELVANRWDAWATRVDIVWPDHGDGACFLDHLQWQGNDRAAVLQTLGHDRLK